MRPAAAPAWTPQPAAAPRKKRTGLVIAAVAVAVLLLGGAAAAAVILLGGGDGAKDLAAAPQLSARDVAERAALRLATDQGIGGNISAETAHLVADMSGPGGSVHMDIGMAQEMYDADAVKMTLTFNTISSNGKQMMGGARMVILCFTDRIVLQTQGFGGGPDGGKDADAETANDAHACVGEKVSKEGLRASMGRVAATMGGGIGQAMVSSFGSMDSAGGDSKRVVANATANSDGVQAKYVVGTEPDTTNVTAQIIDGHIVSEEGSQKIGGGQMTMTITYAYAPRGMPPTTHGAQKV